MNVPPVTGLLGREREVYFGRPPQEVTFGKYPPVALGKPPEDITFGIYPKVTIGSAATYQSSFETPASKTPPFVNNAVLGTLRFK